MSIITDIFNNGAYWITVRCGIKTDSYYQDLGYIIPKRLDNRGRLKVEKNTTILINVTDLKANSRLRVTKVCDKCGALVKNQTYQNIIRRRELNTGMDLCNVCASVKGGESRKNNMCFEDSLQYKYPVIAAKWDHALNELAPEKVASHSSSVYWWKCSHCYSSFNMSVDQMTRDRIKGSGCPYCRGFRINQTNSLWTTHPNIALLLEDAQLGHKVSAGTKLKANFICPNCNLVIQDKYINNVVRRGVPCLACSDGFSYPEKYIAEMLSQLNLTYENQKTFSWSKRIDNENKKLKGNKKYDFYIKNLNCIIEVHGGQHYNGNTYFEFVGGKTLEEERENDRIKKHLALTNGINSYVVIDCRRSECDYVKNSTLNSKISDIVDLEEVNWRRCHEKACNSLVRETGDLWNQKKSIHEISQLLKISNCTVLRYLKSATKAGWCDYLTSS